MGLATRGKEIFSPEKQKTKKKRTMRMRERKDMPRSLIGSSNTNAPHTKPTKMLSPLHNACAMESPAFCTAMMATVPLPTQMAAPTTPHHCSQGRPQRHYSSSTSWVECLLPSECSVVIIKCTRGALEPACLSRYGCTSTQRTRSSGKKQLRRARGLVNGIVAHRRLRGVAASRARSETRAPP